MDITSANAAAVLIVEDLFPAGIDLQMFGTDQGIAQDSIEIAETRIGIDGVMVAGYKPGIIPVTLTLEAASPSFASLATLWVAMQKNKRVYECTLVCSVPSISRVFTWSTGILKSGVPYPSLKKTLAPTNWVFNFQNMDVAGL